jgi:hypothetical protein
MVFARAPVILNPVKFTVELGIKHHYVRCILDDILDPTAPRGYLVRNRGGPRDLPRTGGFYWS